MLRGTLKTQYCSNQDKGSFNGVPMCHQWSVQNLLYSSSHTDTINYFTYCIHLCIGIVHFTTFVDRFEFGPKKRPPIRPSFPHFEFASASCLAPKQDARRKRSHAHAVNQPNAQPAQIPSLSIDGIRFNLIHTQFNSVYHHVERCSCRRRE
jgi:hypothetical protein